MKRVYTAPRLELEVYQLNASIASNCALVIKMGPAMGGHEECEGYVDPFAMPDLTRANRAKRKYNVTFYEDTNCDCYTTGGDSGYWTS